MTDRSRRIVMTDRQLTVFTSEFLELLARREPVPLSTYEATLAGPWTVERRDEEYAVLREGDDEPEAVLRFRDTALLLAAALPVTGRGARYWACVEPACGQGTAIILKTVGEQGPATVGKLGSRHEELLATLSTMEHLLCCPASLAFLIEAAPVEALSRAFELLAGRLKDESAEEGEGHVRRPAASSRTTEPAEDP
jgi:hypothetical protein